MEPDETESVLRAAMGGQGFMKLVGAAIDEVKPGRLVLSLERRAEVLQQHGFFHGGAIAFLVDNATTGVLGYSSRGFGISPAWHLAVGLCAVVFNLWALQEEYRALRENQRLVDRAANELDAIDRELVERGSPPVETPPAPLLSLRNGLTLAIGAWLPYLYQSLIVWRGDFGRVSLHPWIEASVVGCVMIVLALRARATSPQS